MQGQPVAGRPAPAAAPSESAARIGPGFDRMVARREAPADGDAAQNPAPLQDNNSSLKVALLAGDAALCALAAWFAFSRRGELGASDLVVCAAAVLVGLALGWRGLKLDRDDSR